MCNMRKHYKIIFRVLIYFFQSCVSSNVIEIWPDLSESPGVVVFVDFTDGVERSSEKASGGYLSNNVCTRPDCIHVASKILKNIDMAADPCESFYDFACGSLLINSRIPDERNGVSTGFMTTEDAMAEHLRVILEEPTRENEPKAFEVAKTLYQSCMDIARIEARGVQPLLDLLQQVGGWPVLDGDAWNESSFSWHELVYRLHDAGFSNEVFFIFNIVTDTKNSTRKMILLDQPQLEQQREELVQGLDNAVVQAYYAYMIDVAVQLGADREHAANQLNDMLHFEMELAKITLPLAEILDPIGQYNPITIADLTKKVSSIPWLEFINRLLAPIVTVYPEEIINVNVPKYFTDLEVLLEKTSKSVQGNYILWLVVRSAVKFLNGKLRKSELIYLTARYGIKSRESRWKECSDTINNKLSSVVGAMYVRKYFNQSSQEVVEEMVNIVRGRFRQTLTELDWMDEQTRGQALQKADSMISVVGFPYELLDDSKINELNPELEISPDRFLESMLNVTLSNREFEYSQLYKPVNKSDWRSWANVALVNANYDPKKNRIFIPAGILQEAFFDIRRPAFMNFGGIGFAVGHEIVHAFDTMGRRYDDKGNLNDWWQNSTVKEYLQKTNCMVGQYSNFTVKEIGLQVNGETTIGENIADNSACRKSYYAYQDWIKKHGEDQTLPGLERFSPKQLFWLSLGNLWCTVNRDEFAKQLITYDVHAPARFRTDGPLQNMEEFAEDFQCPVGSTMNPAQKCVVW